jgi:hypothetical protein
MNFRQYAKRKIFFSTLVLDLDETNSLNLRGAGSTILVTFTPFCLPGFRSLINRKSNVKSLIPLWLAQRSSWNLCDMHSGVIDPAVTCTCSGVIDPAVTGTAVSLTLVWHAHVVESLTPLLQAQRCHWPWCDMHMQWSHWPRCYRHSGVIATFAVHPPPSPLQGSALCQSQFCFLLRLCPSFFVKIISQK